MKGKKTIVIFTDDGSRNISAAIKERYKDNTAVQVIIISEKELLSFGQLFFENYFLKNDTRLKRFYNRRLEASLEKKMDIIPPQNVSFDGKRAIYNRTYNVYLRYSPDVVMVLTPSVIAPAIAARTKLRRDIKIVSVIDEFVLNKQMVYKQIDKYYADNFDIKARLVECGIDEEKITIVTLPVRQYFSKEIDRETALKSFDLPDKPTVLLASSRYGDEKFKKILSDIEEAKLDINVIVACGLNRKLLAYVREKTNFLGYNEGIDMNMAFSAVDIVIARPTSGLIAEAIFKKKLIFTVYPLGETERRIHDYLGVDLVVKLDSSEEAVENIKKYLSNPESFDEIKNLVAETSSSDSGKEICEDILKLIDVESV